MKPVLKFILVGAVVVGLFAAALEAFGTDINLGYSFTPTDRVTSTKLNNLVSLATINTDFLHLLTAVAPASSDELLVYQASSGLYRKSTVGTFFLGNTNLIMGQTEDTSPGTNDFILTYDVSAGVFKRVALFNVLPTGFNTMVIPPDIGFKMLITSNGVPYWTTLTNLLQQEYRFSQLANPSNAVSDPTNYFLSANTAPKATDAFLLWSGNSNKYTTLAGLITNLTASASPADADLFFTFNASPAQPRKMSVSQLSYKVYQDYVAGITYTKATLGPYPLSANTNVIVNAAHGLPGIPSFARWVLVQTNSVADAGWGQNHEVDIQSFTFTDGTPWYATDVNGTSAVLVGRNGKGDCQVRSGADGVLTAISTNNWNAKAYLIYFP